MEIRHIMHTARSATIEIADGGRYFTKQPVELRVNGEPSLTTEKTITSLFSLKPDQKYDIQRDRRRTGNFRQPCQFRNPPGAQPDALRTEGLPPGRADHPDTLVPVVK